LSRGRLVTGAYYYNGKGDAQYRQKIEKTLDLFGGLSDLIA
jgi:hypothetical protein